MKHSRSTANKPRTDTERQRARYARAELVLGNITLDSAHAAKLAAILARTGETRADFVRRMIREQN